ncbi:hypothetical protein Bbelb_384590 [Branchiostoma belcheri]|nr:hypothetical protein Bbelb_384590 [Branchiostoma belcheri]
MADFCRCALATGKKGEKSADRGQGCESPEGTLAPFGSGGEARGGRADDKISPVGLSDDHRKTKTPAPYFDLTVQNSARCDPNMKEDQTPYVCREEYTRSLYCLYPYPALEQPTIVEPPDQTQPTLLRSTPDHAASPSLVEAICDGHSSEQRGQKLVIPDFALPIQI